MRLASGGSSLYVLASGGSSLKETSWAISASVFDSEGSCAADYNGDDIYVVCPFSMSPDGSFKGGIEVWDAGRDFVHVRVGGVLTFDDL